MNSSHRSKKVPKVREGREEVRKQSNRRSPGRQSMRKSTTVGKPTALHANFKALVKASKMA